MIKTIKELLIEWWAGNSTTKMPIPTIYTYEVDVDDKTITIESMSRSRMYIHYKARILINDLPIFAHKPGNRFSCQS